MDFSARCFREDYSDIVEEPLYSDAMEVSKKVLDDFANGEIGEIYLAYTGFKNTVVHEPISNALSSSGSKFIGVAGANAISM